MYDTRTSRPPDESFAPRSVFIRLARAVPSTRNSVTGRAMEYQDKNLNCADCGGPFIFTAGEQKFYQEKGFGHEPKRCKECRAKRKGDSGVADRSGPSRSAPDGNRASRGGGGGEYFSATCSACG